MANTRNGNTIFIDSTGEASAGANDKVVSIVFTATGNNASVALSDNNSGAGYPKKFHIHSQANDTVYLMNVNAVFPNGVYVTAIANGYAMLIMTNGGA